MARFFQLYPGVDVQYWLEFTAERATALKECAWPEKHFERQGSHRLARDGQELPTTLRLYAQGEKTERGILFALPEEGGFDFARLQFRRSNARVAAIRASDADAPLTGFGRPSPVTGRMSHQDYSETCVDREPGAEYVDYRGEKVIWTGFDPVFLKVKTNSGETFCLAVTISWTDEGVLVEMDLNPGDVPQKLAAFAFPEGQAANPLAKVADYKKEFGGEIRKRR